MCTTQKYLEQNNPDKLYTMEYSSLFGQDNGNESF